MDDNLEEICLMYITLHELKRLLTPIERRPLRVGGEPGHMFMNRILHQRPE